jgi:NAD-specific glutamate dehydrogenase
MSYVAEQVTYGPTSTVPAAPETSARTPRWPSRLIPRSRRLLDRASRRFLAHRPQPLAVGAEICRFRATIDKLREQVPHLLGERESTALSSRVRARRRAGRAPLLRLIHIT